VKDLDITKVDWSAWPCVYGVVINSAIAYPPRGSTVSPSANGKIEISGWAHGAGEVGN